MGGAFFATEFVLNNGPRTFPSVPTPLPEAASHVKGRQEKDTKLPKEGTHERSKKMCPLNL
jgi:hypothetical protein